MPPLLPLPTPPPPAHYTRNAGGSSPPSSMAKKRGSKAASGGGSSKEGEPAGKEGEQAAVLSLKMDSTTPEAPREVAESGAFQTPCSVTGLGAGVSGGMLGFVWGFGEPRAGRRQVGCGGGVGCSVGLSHAGCRLACCLHLCASFCQQSTRCVQCRPNPQPFVHAYRRLLGAQHQGRRPVEGFHWGGLGLGAGAPRTDRLQLPICCAIGLCLLEAFDGGLCLPEAFVRGCFARLSPVDGFHRERRS